MKLTAEEKAFADKAWEMAQRKSFDEFDFEQSALNILAYMMKRDEFLVNNVDFSHRTPLRLNRMRGLVLMVLDELKSQDVEAKA